MIPTALDHGALATRLMHPDRPRRAEALAAVGTRTDPGWAWAALVSEGLIPRSWATGDRRGFASTCNACGGIAGPRVMFCESCHGKGWVALPYPPTVSGCVALAAGAEGMAWAEALARAAIQHLGAWGCPQPVDVVWQVGEGPVPGPEILGIGTIVDALGASGAIAGPSEEDEGDRAARAVLGDHEAKGATRLHQVANYCYVAGLWRAACVGGRKVTLGSAVDVEIVSRDVVGRPFAELPDPFMPLLGVWSLGYALDDVTAEEFLMVAPEGKRDV